MIQAEEQLELKIHKNWGIFFSPISINIILKYKFISPELWYNVCVPISLWPHLAVLTDYHLTCPQITYSYSIPCLIHSYRTPGLSCPPHRPHGWRTCEGSRWSPRTTYYKHSFIILSSSPFLVTTTTTFVTDKNYKISTFFVTPTPINNFNTNVWMKSWHFS